MGPYDSFINARICAYRAGGVARRAPVLLVRVLAVIGSRSVSNPLVPNGHAPGVSEVRATRDKSLIDAGGGALPCGLAGGGALFDSARNTRVTRPVASVSLRRKFMIPLDIPGNHAHYNAY